MGIACQTVCVYKALKPSHLDVVRNDLDWLEKQLTSQDISAFLPRLTINLNVVQLLKHTDNTQVWATVEQNYIIDS